SHDYYGHSVTVGLAPLRPSRIPLCAGRIERDLGVPSVPLNRLVACRPPVGRFKTTKLGIVRYRWPRHQVSCRRVCRLHRWRLGFRQCGFHRITRDLHGSAFDTFAAFRAFPPCCFPLPLSRSGWVGVPEVTSSRTSAPWGGRSSAGLDGASSPHTGLSTCLARWSTACGGGCRWWGPGGRDFAAAVAVAGYRDAGCAGEGDPVVGESPPCVAEAAAELCHSEGVFTRVLGAYPAHQSIPRVVIDCAEYGLGYPVPEVVRPPA